MSQNYIQIFDDTVIKMSVNQGLEDQRVSTTLGAFTMGELAFTRDSGRLFVGDNSDESEAHKKLQRTVGGILTGNKYLGKIDTRDSSIENEIGLDSKFKLKSDDFSASSIDDLTEENWIRWNRASHYSKKYDAMNGDLLYDVNENSLILFDESVKGIFNDEKINIPVIGGFTKNGKLSYKTYQQIGDTSKCYVRTKLNDDDTRVAVDSEGKETTILVSTTARYCYYTGTSQNPADDNASSHWEECNSNDQTLVIYVDEYEIPLKDQSAAKERTVAFNISDESPQFGDGYVIFRNVIPDGTTIGFKNVEDYEVNVINGVPTILTNDKSGKYTHNVLEVKSLPADKIIEQMSDDFVENDENKVSLKKNAVINQISTESNALRVPNVIKFSSDLTGTSTREDAENGVTFNIKSEVNQTPVTSLNGQTLFIYGPTDGTVERVVFDEQFAKLHAGDGILLNGSKNVDVDVANTITLSVDQSSFDESSSKYDPYDRFYYPSSRQTDFYPGPCDAEVVYAQNLVIEKSSGKIIASDKYYNDDYIVIKNLFDNENSSINYLKQPYSLVFTEGNIDGSVDDTTPTVDMQFIVTPEGVAAKQWSSNYSLVLQGPLYVKDVNDRADNQRQRFMITYPKMSGVLEEIESGNSYAYTQQTFISDFIDDVSGERLQRIGENEILDNLATFIISGPGVEETIYTKESSLKNIYITDIMNDSRLQNSLLKNAFIFTEEGQTAPVSETRTLCRFVDKDQSYRRSNESIQYIEDVKNLLFEFNEVTQETSDFVYVNIKDVESIKAYGVIIHDDYFEVTTAPSVVSYETAYDDIGSAISRETTVALQAYKDGLYSTPIFLSGGDTIYKLGGNAMGGAPAHARSVLLEVSRFGYDVYSNSDFAPLTISTSTDFSINTETFLHTLVWIGPDNFYENNEWGVRHSSKVLLSRARQAGSFFDVIEVPLLTDEHGQQIFNLSIYGLRSRWSQYSNNEPLDVLNIRYMGYRV